jgi:hypothetical protein
MTLPPTFLERSGTGLTPGSLMTRFKEWSPRAPLELEKILCTRNRCTDSRLSQVDCTGAPPGEAIQTRAAKRKNKDKKKNKEKKETINMKT